MRKTSEMSRFRWGPGNTYKKITEINHEEEIITSTCQRPRAPARDWDSFSPYLWSVFLELTTLLNKFFPGLLTFILPVRQYCCCGIELSLGRKRNKNKQTKYSQNSVTEIKKKIIKKTNPHTCIMLLGIWGWKGWGAAQNKHQASRDLTSWITANETLQPFGFHLATKTSPLFSKLSMALPQHHTGQEQWHTIHTP